MALTRKFLSALGIEAEKIDEIISAHTETVDALKEQRDSYKADSEKLSEVQKSLDESQKQIDSYKKDAESYQQIKEEYEKLKTGSESSADFEQKYNDLKTEFDNFKAEQEKKTAREAKETAYKKLLADAGVSDKRIASILKVTDLGKVELDKEGNLKDSDKLKESIKTEWSDFIVSERTKGAEVSNPPEKNDGKMSKADILNIQDPVTRQQKIAENHELFGI